MLYPQDWFILETETKSLYDLEYEKHQKTFCPSSSCVHTVCLYNELLLATFQLLVCWTADMTHNTTSIRSKLLSVFLWASVLSPSPSLPDQNSTCTVYMWRFNGQTDTDLPRAQTVSSVDSPQASATVRQGVISLVTMYHKTGFNDPMIFPLVPPSGQILVLFYVWSVTALELTQTQKQRISQETGESSKHQYVYSKSKRSHTGSQSNTVEQKQAGSRQRCKAATLETMRATWG